MQKKTQLFNVRCAKKEYELLLNFFKAKQWDMKEAVHDRGEPQLDEMGQTKQRYHAFVNEARKQVEKNVLVI